jgi:hypothetical protein
VVLPAVSIVEKASLLVQKNIESICNLQALDTNAKSAREKVAKIVVIAHFVKANESKWFDSID